jgi:hypothetical protein
VEYFDEMTLVIYFLRHASTRAKAVSKTKCTLVHSYVHLLQSMHHTLLAGEGWQHEAVGHEMSLTRPFVAHWIARADGL